MKHQYIGVRLEDCSFLRETDVWDVHHVTSGNMGSIFWKKLQLKNVAQAEAETEASAQLRWKIVFGKKWINTHDKSSAALIHNGSSYP